MYIKCNSRYTARAVFTRMINITEIINSTQIAAVIALVATAIIVVGLRPKSHKDKRSHLSGHRG